MVLYNMASKKERRTFEPLERITVEDVEKIVEEDLDKNFRVYDRLAEI